MPGGGDASIAFMLADLRRPATLVVEALVDVRVRFAGASGVAVEGASGEAWADSGCGKGTGVGVACSEDGMVLGGWRWGEDKRRG